MSHIFESGMSVQIERSDGRRHEAKLQSVSAEEGIAIVVFEENDQVLEKEVVLSDLFRLNRHHSQKSVHNSSVCKKSPVVEKIERIGKNRCERRANQKALRAVNVPSRNTNLSRMIRENREKMLVEEAPAKKLYETGNMCVCVRKRPISAEEAARGDVDIVTVRGGSGVVVHEPRQKVDQTPYLENHCFRFDCVFDEGASNSLVYRKAVRPLLKWMVEGRKAACFTYGQTGSGKTYTMEGQDSAEGVYSHVARDLFQLTQGKLDVFVSFFELYNCKVLDLLKRKNQLKVLEEKKVFNVVGLTEVRVASAEETVRVIRRGTTARSSGQTAMNLNSSRSHAILQIVLKRGGAVFGKMAMIDLAGNERAVDMNHNDFNIRREASDINKSLLCLKECIRALFRKGQHVPYRGSKLTCILRDLFESGTRSCMISTISPTQLSSKQTLNTLGYAELLTVVDPHPKGDPIDNDLLYVSVNSDLPENWSFHQRALQQLEECEERICVTHSHLARESTDYAAKLKTLLEAASNPYFQVTDDYLSRMDALLESHRGMMSNLEDQLKVYRKIKDEEELLHRNVIK